MDFDELEKIIGLLKHTDIAEFEFEKEGAALRIRRGMSYESRAGAENMGGVLRSMTNAPVGAAPAVEGGELASEEEGLVRIESPIVGTFYGKPGPEADAFVEAGNRVKKGDTLCIVEAMKLMNEIEATVSGVVEKVLLKDGEVVEFGEVLFLIRPD